MQVVDDEVEELVDIGMPRIVLYQVEVIAQLLVPEECVDGVIDTIFVKPAKVEIAVLGQGWYIDEVVDEVILQKVRRYEVTDEVDEDEVMIKVVVVIVIIHIEGHDDAENIVVDIILDDEVEELHEHDETEMQILVIEEMRVHDVLTQLQELLNIIHIEVMGLDTAEMVLLDATDVEKDEMPLREEELLDEEQHEYLLLDINVEHIL